MAAVLLAGCAVGPDYKKPDTATPAQYKEAGEWVKANPGDAVPKGKWWVAFHDPILDALEEQVQVSNQTLAAAEARYRQAHASVKAAQSGLFPTVGYDAGATRTRATATRYSVSLDAQWEIDLWGRIRRTVEAAKATEEASAADVENARLSMQADLATAYFSLRVADTGNDLLVDMVKAFQSNYDLTKNRYAAGVVSKVDVVQAQTQLLSTQAQLIDLRATRATLEHSIAVLAGKAPSEFMLTPVKLDVHIPGVPPGVPSTLLERRPDIASAERSMAAANARIGVAEAAYFPALSLTGNAGYAGGELAKLFSAPNRFWALGADLAGTLLDFGARSAQVELQRAAYDEQVANYRQAVLGGLQEVEDNLATVHWLTEETNVETEAVRAARESVALTLNQYKAGTVSFLNVALVQATQLNEERTMVTLLGRRLAATVALMRALGGTWQ
ncbi:MAG TPA: efflux transporter outer membrane subunit [Usitatibacter sp.]|nr:efflux transporter outer membrane subunit [Usitatibacter sp.]